MQLMSLPPPRPTVPYTPDGRTFDALAGVVSRVGDSAFSKDALAQINRWLPVAWLSVYRLFPSKPPTLHGNASFEFPDGTMDSWQVYRDGLYKQDETFLAAREQMRENPQVMVHWNAKEIPRPHRDSIYSRHCLRERLSIACREDGDALLAVNLYRTDEQSEFSDSEMLAVGNAAGLLLSCVQRHLTLASAAPRNDAALGRLTRREREVCERMLRGLSYDGIAADLGVSAGTVKTYRDRAFERLGIHHRNELFALVAGELAAS